MSIQIFADTGTLGVSAKILITKETLNIWSLLEILTTIIIILFARYHIARNMMVKL